MKQEKESKFHEMADKVKYVAAASLASIKDFNEEMFNDISKLFEDNYWLMFNYTMAVLMFGEVYDEGDEIDIVKPTAIC